MYLKLGTVTTVVISSPHLAKQVLQTHDHLFSSRYLSDTICSLNHENTSVVFLPVCAKWRNLRKAIATELFSQAQLDANQAIRFKNVQQLVKHVGENTGKVLDVGFVAFITMINLLSNSLMSVDLTDYDSESSLEFRVVVTRALELVAKPNLSNFFPALRFFDLQGLRKENEYNMIRILAIIGSFVDQRECSRIVSDDGRSRDVLDALLRKQSEYELSSKDIRHLFADLFAAGSDTSTTTVEWAMAELLRNPNKMKKAQLEIRSVLGKEEKLVRESDITKLKYVQAVVKETLRLHPPAPFLVPHKSITDVNIDGFTVPVGSQILINVWSMGHDSKIWTNPDSFEPERFLESEMEYKGRNFELIPFGAGRRICWGNLGIWQLDGLHNHQNSSVASWRKIASSSFCCDSMKNRYDLDITIDRVIAFRIQYFDPVYSQGLHEI
ncbi:unnamed protein product [Rhodiola kirilowii]